MDDNKTVQTALAWLKRFDRFHIRPGLERMEAMLEALGRPERGLSFLHIAGTNGKGSTGAFLAGMLRELGFSVGVFSSPAIMHELDRIQYNGSRIGDAEFVACAERLKRAVSALQDRPTEFEVITALALVYFERVRPDWVIWEAGLGGRWDATNVVEPRVAVVTNVGHDHLDVLGNTLSKIAAEKAGIVKAGHPVVTAAEGVAESVIKKRAGQLGCPYYQLDSCVRAVAHVKREGVSSFSYTGLERTLHDLTIALPGEHQIRNASLSLLVLEVLSRQGCVTLDDAAIRRGLRRTKWPGRMELISKHPRILLDAAHNPEAAARLREALPAYFAYRRLCVIAGIFADKDVMSILKPLGELADCFILTSGDHPRYMPADALANVLANECSCTIKAVSKAEEAVREAVKKCGTDDLILVAGSHDLMSTVRRYIVSDLKAKVGDDGR